MIYAISDLHSYPLSKLLKLLEKVKFNNEDFLYVLGDVIDRCGDGGIETLEWMMLQPNVQLIMGNHEAMLLSCTFLFDEITDQNIEKLSAQKMELYMNYISNGGEVTLNSLKKLSAVNRHAVFDILDFINDAPLYEAVSVDGRDFLLTHSGLDNFEKGKKLSQYEADDFLWARPSPEDSYFEGIITVFGHTPTFCFGNEYNGKAFRTESWIDIDAGVASGNSPILLRLDDLTEFIL